MERLAEEKAKRKVASKRQEELELRKKQEEVARQKKLLQVVSQLRSLFKMYFCKNYKWRIIVTNMVNIGTVFEPAEPFHGSIGQATVQK